MHPQRTEFTETEAQEIVRIAAERGWQIAAHEHMRIVNHRAYRLAVDEYGAQLRFLLPLSPDASVLQVRCDWGRVALNLGTWTGSTIAMDDREARVRFVSARRFHMGANRLHIVRGSPLPNLPFVDDAFDAVILLDVLERAQVRGANWKTIQRKSLDEAKRVLRSGGSLLLDSANRLGFGRAKIESPSYPRTYWGYHQILRNAGFRDIQFYGSLPSHHEPFFILPLRGRRLLKHLIDKMFSAEDYRSKLEERGLGFVYRLAWAMWRMTRHLGVAGLVRYVVPSYVILARK